MGRLLELARSAGKTAVPEAPLLDKRAEKPSAPAPQRRTVPIRVSVCPGCRSPIDGATTQWGGVPVCGACWRIADANPDGFGLTLGFHCRKDAAKYGCGVAIADGRAGSLHNVAKYVAGPIAVYDRR